MIGRYRTDRERDLVGRLLDTAERVRATAVELPVKHFYVAPWPTAKGEPCARCGCPMGDRDAHLGPRGEQ